MRANRRWIAIGAVTAILLGVAGALGPGWWGGHTSALSPGPVAVFQIRDASPSLGAVFHPGVILVAGANASTVFLGGIGVYVRSPEFTLPVVATLTRGPSGPAAQNVTPLLNDYFWEGGIYGETWNGTSWLIAGQAGWGGGNTGAMVSIEGGRVINRTALLGPTFAGGGIFAIAWNGSAWMLGGNSSGGLALATLEGSRLTDLSSEIHGTVRDGWIQALQWNGAEWLIGGQGILETWRGGNWTDLLADSPFTESGVYAASWNGSAWLVGGGAGQAITIADDTVGHGPKLPAAFDQAVLFLAPVLSGWLVGGKGTTSTGGIAPELAYWASAGPRPSVTDLSADIPNSFAGGEVQSGSPAPMLGPSSYLLVGDGSYDVHSGYGVGSVAWLTFS
ncbi:MAG TPA: hypothetical protein VGX00_05905 [Thermoplasmata archaeon]|nr:hypothetical protein [Thermoplasmata archaeon]